MTHKARFYLCLTYIHSTHSTHTHTHTYAHYDLLWHQNKNDTVSFSPLIIHIHTSKTKFWTAAIAGGLSLGS